MNLEASLAGHGIVVWTGWRETSWPSRDKSRLVERFGSETAAELLLRIRAMEE
jgi:hypothetical protein